MIPVFQILNKTLSAYVLAAAFGAVITVFSVYLLAKKNGLDEIQMLIMSCFSFIALAIGGSLLYGLTNLPLVIDAFQTFDASAIGTFFNKLGTAFGGSVFYGGLIGVIFVAWLYTKKKNLSMRYIDLAAIGITVFHFFGRIGCFLTGCCYGIESHIGFIYRHSLIASANDVRRFPVQLIEVALNAILFFVLLRLFQKKKAEGYLIHIYLYCYPIVRFFDEFLRGDSYRGFLFGLSTSQWVSLLLLVGNTFCLLWRLKHSKSADALHSVEHP